MIQCGIGVGVGWGTNDLSPGAMADQLTQIYGANLVGLWIADEAVFDGSNQVTSWPSHAGLGPTLANYTAGRATRSTINGRPAFLPPTAVGFSLHSATVPSYIEAHAVAITTPLPLAYYETLVRAVGSGEAILGAGTGTSALFTSSGTITHWVDGVLTDSLTSGAHIFTGLLPSAQTSLHIGGLDTTATWTWKAPISTVFLLASASTPEQRAASNAVQARRYRL